MTVIFGRGGWWRLTATDGEENGRSCRWWLFSSGFQAVKGEGEREMFAGDSPERGETSVREREAALVEKFFDAGRDIEEMEAAVVLHGAWWFVGGCRERMKMEKYFRNFRYYGIKIERMGELIQTV